MSTIEQYLLNAEGAYTLHLKSDSGEIKSSEISGLRLPAASIFDKNLGHEFVRKIYNE